MDDARLLRYSRQILLPQVEVEGQQRLLDATVLVVGLGGLGSPVAIYLAAAGVGHLVLADPDVVELSNLQRQVLHTSADIDRPKVISAREHLASLNPEVRITTHSLCVDEGNLPDLLEGVDVVVDGSDNFSTRFALNAACIRAGVPLVMGAAIRLEGQVSVFDPREEESPCYRCLYDESAHADESCTRNGVLAPLLGIVGSIQATEAMKLIIGMGEPLIGRLLLIDALEMEIRTVRLRRSTDCPICRKRHRHAPGKDS